MAYQLPVKYFNSFWLKKVVGSQSNTQNAYESKVTTDANVSGNKPQVAPGVYTIPTWPGIPWGSELTQPQPTDSNVLMAYPCFPWGGRNWNSYDPLSQGGSTNLPNCSGSLLNSYPSEEAGIERNWAIEEARIYGGYNNTTVDFGVKAYAVEEDNQRTIRTSAMIYSGVFNSLTGVNNTNVFSTAEPITKSVDPDKGPIQKLYAYDTNLTIFQENKVSKALIDKDAIYSAEGVGTPVSSLKVVIGQIVPYTGEYGISKNPESWAQYGFRQYFADKYRNAVLRLSRDGITEISTYGMTDYFRDRFSTISDGPQQRSLSFDFFDDGLVADQLVTSFEIVLSSSSCSSDDILIGSLLRINNVTVPGLFVTAVQGNLVTVSKPWKPSMFNIASYSDLEDNYRIFFISYVYDRLIGGFDTHNNNYVINVKDAVANPCIPVTETREVGDNADYTDRFRTYNTYDTLAFDESINGWVSFFSYNPVIIDSVKNDYFTVDHYKLYKHYDGGGLNHGNFYGTHYSSSIEFIFNPRPSIVKNFQTISYEGSSGWGIDYFVSDATAALYNVFSGTYYAAQDLTSPVLSLEEGKYTNTLTQQTEYAGFYLKENKYCSNLVNNSSPFQGEVVFGESMSGIKGYYATVKLKTDNTTQVGGLKELYCVTSKWVLSSQ